MSHIGKKLIKVPHNIEVNIKTIKENNNKIIYIKNKLKIIELEISSLILVKIFKYKNKEYISLEPKNFFKNKNLNNVNKIWGLTRSLIFNKIKGLNQGFIKKLILVGIGYKVRLENNILVLKLGYSHLIYFNIPDNISIKVKKPTLIYIEGKDKNLVSSIAAIIRSFKKPEPYNGKGIRYINEKVIIKERSN